MGHLVGGLLDVGQALVTYAVMRARGSRPGGRRVR